MASSLDPKPLHPLHQIAESPTHKLLLKQWLKEEELISARIALKETRIDATRKEITQLYCFFFIFHSSILLLLFGAAASREPRAMCHRSWIPSLCSLICSLAIIWAIRYKTDVESHMEKLLEREKEDVRLLMKCVQELKKKGTDFDLLKEVDALRRAKSLRVETNAVKRWLFLDFVFGWRRMSEGLHSWRWNRGAESLRSGADVSPSVHSSQKITPKTDQ
ncbi:hypothetical protein H6P81_019612 [Aristolochia fimbriata]|uniref:Transmembrane protein n=1 Tax=Aristolochia fimbriata TaxID=158543 RepID=A0AAV7DSB0_ARIFI|nr:hypothetical protein H6P81_019612 [Aristolochia fimbriata]